MLATGKIMGDEADRLQNERMAKLTAENDEKIELRLMEVSQLLSEGKVDEAQIALSGAERIVPNSKTPQLRPLREDVDERLASVPLERALTFWRDGDFEGGESEARRAMGFKAAPSGRGPAAPGMSLGASRC